MTDKAQELTKKQIVQATRKGGGAALRKADVLFRKIKKGKASEEDIATYDKIFSKVLSLIGEQPVVASQEPGVPSSYEEERLWVKAIEEQCNPYVVQYDKGEIGYSRLDEVCKGITRQITGVERMSKPCARRFANMQKFRAEGKHVKMFSHKLNKEIAVISKEDQRGLYGDLTVYTMDESLAIAEAELEADVAKAKIIDLVKEAIDGEVVRK